MNPIRGGFILCSRPDEPFGSHQVEARVSKCEISSAETDELAAFVEYSLFTGDFDRFSCTAQHVSTELLA